MTSKPTRPKQQRDAFVWVWLREQVDPVVAGVISPTGGKLASEPVLAFRYASSYLERPNAMSLWEVELPLNGLTFDPSRPPVGRDPLSLASCLRDGAPDAWGRRVINLRLGQDADSHVDELTYLLGSGSDRIGALDFQSSPSEYVSRNDAASLEQLMEFAALVEAGEQVPDSLLAAAQHGTSIGGARPKALLTDGPRRLVAKFSSSSDDWPVVQAEALAMLLAARAGINVAPVEVRRVNGQEVLLVERFDRGVTAAGAVTRRSMLSMLTVLGLHASGSWGASYADIAQAIRTGPWTEVPSTLEEMFSRLVFNIFIGNNDDHLRNHAAFWDGRALSLTPAYDLAPQTRNSETSSQAIAVTRDGRRASQLQLALAVAGEFHLTPSRAVAIIEQQRAAINTHWDECADLARLTGAQRSLLYGRQFLNPYIDYQDAE